MNAMTHYVDHLHDDKSLAQTIFKVTINAKNFAF